MFLGLQQKGTNAKQGEKPLLIPDFVNLGTYDNREEKQETGNNSSGAKLVIRLARGKPKLEHNPFYVDRRKLANYARAPSNRKTVSDHYRHR